MNASPARVIAEPAALGWRLLALVYDLFPLFGIWFACGALALLANAGEALQPGSFGSWLLRIVLLAATFAYFGLSWRHGGQTLGMRAWRLRLVAADGEAPRWPQLLRRFAIGLLSTAAAGLGFLWSLIDRERRSWHDLGSSTVLVRLPKPEKPHPTQRRAK